MKVFRSVKDLGNLQQALQEAMEIKADRFKYQELGKNKTALLIFFNNSLRTRLSPRAYAKSIALKYEKHM